MHLKTPGIVLRSADYKEADKILTVLTQAEGKRTIRARGCRRKGSRISVQSQVLVYSEMDLFTYKDRLTLEEASTLQEFRHVRGSIETLALGTYFADVTEAVAEEGRGEQALLSLLLNSLYVLDTLKKPEAIVKTCFEIRLICIAGYEPILDSCVFCGAEMPEHPELDLEEGVLHCHDCPTEGKSLPLDSDSLTAMRHAAYGDAKRLFSVQLKPTSLKLLAAVSETFLTTQLERSFHTLDYYKQIRQEII